MMHTVIPVRSAGKAAQIRSVQALRAVAALAVVGFHSTVLWHDSAPLAGILPWSNGNAGVDLFFVISGFIMILSSEKLRTAKLGWLKFIRLRLIRIVPLYWLATAAKLGAIIAFPSFALHTRPTLLNVIASFLFLPSRDATGNITPVLTVGWTLSFEMLFYTIFSLALFLTISPIAIVGPVMVAVALLATQREANWPTLSMLADPIVLEFVFGALLGQWCLMRNASKISKPFAVAVGVAGLTVLLFVPATGSWERTFIWGAAAAATVWAALATEAWAGRWVPSVLIMVGEASYSLYLTHGFVLPVVGKLVGIGRVTVTTRGLIILPTCLVCSTILAVLVYRFVEMPITNWLRVVSGEWKPSVSATDNIASLARASLL